MNNAKDLIFDFTAFTGSLNHYSHQLPMTPELRLTDGTKSFAEKMGAYWLMDIIATEFLPLLSEEDYIIFIEVTVNDDNSAVIVGTDGDKGGGPITLHTRTIEYTDLPTNSGFKFYLQDGVLMLPSEY
tara:strand:- start:21 stop:404 length:384 start_codon:yes stop_codon:yes gene_type:complete